MKVSKTASQLSARAVAVRAVFLKMQEDAPAIGWQAVHDRIHAEAGRLEPEVRGELRSFLDQIRPETPEQATRNACRVLEEVEGGALVASILASDQGKPAEVIAFLEGEMATLTAPGWVKRVIQMRIDAERERAKPQPMVKVSTPMAGSGPKVGPTPLSKMNDLLEKMKNGEWVFALACRLMDESKQLADEALKGAFETVMAERQTCFEKCRGPAGSILEDLGHRVAAEALWQEPNGALDALDDAKWAKNVPAWIKGVIGFRIGQLEAVARERERVAEELRVIADVEKVIGLLDKAMDVVAKAKKFSSMMGNFLDAAETAYDEAVGVQLHLPVLERIVTGQGPKGNCVAKRLADDAELATAVAAGVKEGRGATKFRFGILNLVRDAIAQLRQEVEEAVKVTPVAQGSNGSKKRKKPAVWQNVVDSPRRHGYRR